MRDLFMSSPSEGCTVMVQGWPPPPSSPRSGGCLGGSSGRGVSTRCRTVSSLCLMAPAIPSWMPKVWSSFSTSSTTAPDMVCRCKLFCVCVCVCV